MGLFLFNMNNPMFKKILNTILLTAIGAGLGATTAHYQPTQWQAQAQFTTPKMAELGNYFSLFSTFQLVSGDAEAVDISKMESKATQTAFSIFSQNLTASEPRITFLSQQPSVQQRAELEGLSAKAYAEKLAQGFQNNVNGDSVNVSFSSYNLADVDNLFVEYLKSVNTTTRTALNNELINKWKALFQQVKTAAEAKLDASWENKLKMMQSVQPLDNNLVAFHFEKNASLNAIPKPYLIFAGLGAIAGFMMSLIALAMLNVRTKKQVS
mgnify:FL=1